MGRLGKITTTKAATRGKEKKRPGEAVRSGIPRGGRRIGRARRRKGCLGEERLRVGYGQSVLLRGRCLGCGYRWSELIRCVSANADVQYNEYNPAFPPPPLAIPASDPTGGHTLGQDEMAAILDSGWDEPRSQFQPPQPRQNGYAPSPLQRGAYTPPEPTTRYATQNGGYEVGSYVPIESPRAPGQTPNTGDSISSSVDSRLGGSGHAKKRSGGRAMGDKDRWGPLGPLANDHTGWGQKSGSKRM